MMRLTTVYASCSAFCALVSFMTLLVLLGACREESSTESAPPAQPQEEPKAIGDSLERADDVADPDDGKARSDADSTPEEQKEAKPEYGEHPPSEPRKWNIVLVTADTLRGDMLGVNGNTEIKTPRLDALAAEGVNFPRAYTNITTTTPSFATIFSSLYPQDHKVYSNMERISDDVVLLPELLKQAGWHTAGYINMPWLNPDVSGVSRGIDELDPGNRIRKADATNRWVLDFFDRRKEKPDEPFYLWVQYIDNHTPYHSPGEFDRMYYPEGRDPRAGTSGSLQEVWPRFPLDMRDNEYVDRWLRGVTDKDYVIAHYKGSVSWIDRKVGNLVDRLRDNGQWDNTLFVFTSDHGESLGEHEIWFSHGGLFETTARIPMIIRAPEGPAGQEVNAIVSLVDLMPTILNIVGLEVPKQARGSDVWRAARGESPGPMAALLDHTGRQLTGVVTPQFKYIKHLRTRRDIYPGYPIVRGTVELYDLTKDPHELNNLAEEMPEVVENLENLRAELAAGERAFGVQQAEIDEDTEEALRALGYIQ